MTRDEAAVLFANDAFYAAFAGGDVETMEAVWSASAPVSCIHPGSGVLRGRAAVMDGWRQVLDGGGIDVRVAEATALLYGDYASVTCYEVLGKTVLAVTNLFVRDGELWKMVHHQAGSTPARPEIAEAGGETLQ